MTSKLAKENCFETEVEIEAEYERYYNAHEVTRIIMSFDEINSAVLCLNREGVLELIHALAKSL